MILSLRRNGGLSGVDVDDGEVGEGQVFVDALMPLLIGSRLMTTAARRGSSAQIAVTAASESPRCARTTSAWSTRSSPLRIAVNGVVECGLSSSHGADLQLRVGGCRSS